MAKRNADLVALGGRIAQLRRERGLKQDQVAYEAGIATKTLSEIERGIGNATVVTLLGISRAMNVNVQSLFAPLGEGLLTFRDRGADELCQQASADEKRLSRRILALLVDARVNGG
jgi:transcriptional regulator with XRE-family HTH domain